MKALRDLRLARGLSQRELAAALGVTAAAVNKWELGKSWPAAPMLPQIAAVLGCSIEELYGEDPGGASPSPTDNYTQEAGE